jgi:hypothetical protein
MLFGHHMNVPKEGNFNLWGPPWPFYGGFKDPTYECVSTMNPTLAPTTIILK